MAIPANAQAIWNFLIGQGFNDNAAAGILGNIEQESGGDPEEQGGGLIQILGQAGGTLAEQLSATMQYILANGSISDINAHASSASAAALYFSDSYERPDAALANNANRESSAQEVLAAAQSGNWQSGSGTSNSASGTSDSASGLLSWPGDITGFFKDSKTFLDAALWLVNPASWLRIGAFIVGLGLLAFAAYGLVLNSQGDSPIPKVAPVPVPV